MAETGYSLSQSGCFEEVTVAELIRQFAYWRKFSERTPISITNHGHVTHVMMGTEAFSAMRQTDNTLARNAPHNNLDHLLIIPTGCEFDSRGGFPSGEKSESMTPGFGGCGHGFSNSLAG